MATDTGNKKQTQYVTLVSSDGFEFQVLRSAACTSGLVKKMLDPNSKLCMMISQDHSC